MALRSATILLTLGSKTGCQYHHTPYDPSPTDPVEPQVPALRRHQRLKSESANLPGSVEARIPEQAAKAPGCRGGLPDPGPQLRAGSQQGGAVFARLGRLAVMSLGSSAKHHRPGCPVGIPPQYVCRVRCAASSKAPDAQMVHLRLCSPLAPWLC